MTRASNDGAGARKRPLVAEVVGAAGAGKTTLLRALSRRDATLRAIFGFRRIEYVPYFVYYGLGLLPTVARACLGNALLSSDHATTRPRDYATTRVVRARLGGARLSWREIRMMAHLEATLHSVRASRPGTRTILDQGPVYMLTRLRGWRDGRADSHALETWWDRLLQQWASALDFVVWLDAPDAILLERIRARDKWHSVKNAPEYEACRFLADFRIAYEQIVSMMETHGGLQVLRFDTSQETLERIVDQILAAFDRAAGAERIPMATLTPDIPHLAHRT